MGVKVETSVVLSPKFSRKELCVCCHLKLVSLDIKLNKLFLKNWKISPTGFIRLSMGIIRYARTQNLLKTTKFCPLIPTRRCGYKGVRYVSFSEGLPHVLSEWSPRGHPFSTHAKFSEELTFFIPWYAKVLVCVLNRQYLSEHNAQQFSGVLQKSCSENFGKIPIVVM